MEFSVEILLMLTLVAFVAGFIDAIAGGGGLLTIPALLMAGLNPVQALATNKLQASFGSFSASAFFIRRGLVRPSEQKIRIVLVALGAGFGAWLVQQLNSAFLMMLMPYALMAIALYLLLARGFGQKPKPPKLSEPAFNASLIPAVGMYDGFFGPGTGTFFTLGFSQLRGMDLLTATAHAKLMNFVTNIVSLVVFMLSGQMVWLLGLSMAVGQALGARLGAATALKQGVGLIRWVTVLVCVAISVSLLVRG